VFCSDTGPYLTLVLLLKTIELKTSHPPIIESDISVMGVFFRTFLPEVEKCVDDVDQIASIFTRYVSKQQFINF
jgi:hypothetical protein